MAVHALLRRATLGIVAMMAATAPATATPANKAALEGRYGPVLPARIAACIACHRTNPAGKLPVDLAQFPHNPFGERLAALGKQWRAEGRRSDIDRRIREIAGEDSDSDGVANETELLLGTSPGNPRDVPSTKALLGVERVRTAFDAYRARYRWQPFERVERPAVPRASGLPARANPIDRFLDAKRAAAGTRPHGPADRSSLLRRATLDLTGLAPTPEETAAFLADTRPGAWDRAVDRLLASPRYGERWARHWMDIWRYSDWAGWNDGGQIRDSQPHIWRWRDWIVESLNANTGYDAMVRSMLAADELHPDDPSALRATGFLVRNYKLLSREQWMEDTVNHTSRAFLGLTMHCAKCHAHMTDPIPQEAETRRSVVDEDLAAVRAELVSARSERDRAGDAGAESVAARRADSRVALAEAASRKLETVLAVEAVEAKEGARGGAWEDAARAATAAGREHSLAAARREVVLRESDPPSPDRDTKLAAARAALAAAEKALAAEPSTDYPKRTRSFPSASTGRRAALARWMVHRDNPLAARVAVNHIWLRHFGAALAPSVADFGRKARPPVHPELLDWLAVDFMEHGWDMKRLHRMILSSAAYQMDGRPDPAMARRDPDNLTLWRMNARRLEAEAVRDNLLFASGHLDESRGGPEVDHREGLVSRRRSLYLRTAAEKQSEFLQVFDAPSVTECYERKQSVLPQQALALANSELALREARALAEALAAQLPYREAAPQFIDTAWNRVLGRAPRPEELRLALAFLADRPAGSSLARRYAHLVLVLFNHTDFVTIR